MWVHLQHGQGPTCYLISARLPKIGIAIATARQFAKSDSANPWSAENLSSLSMGGLVAGICLGQRLAWTLSERRWGGGPPVVVRRHRRTSRSWSGSSSNSRSSRRRSTCCRRLRRRRGRNRSRCRRHGRRSGSSSCFMSQSHRPSRSMCAVLCGKNS